MRGVLDLSFSISPSKRQPRPPRRRRDLHSPPQPPEGTNRFLITEYKHKWIDSTLLIWLETDIAIHLTLCWTQKALGKHKIAFPIAGYQMTLLPYFCFVECTPVDQNEPGDTTQHTFTFGGWAVCEERWWLIYGDVGGIRSPSVSPVFYAHYGDYNHADPDLRYVEDLGEYSTEVILTDHVKLEGKSGVTITRISESNSFKISII